MSMYLHMESYLRQLQGGDQRAHCSSAKASSQLAVVRQQYLDSRHEALANTLASTLTIVACVAAMNPLDTVRLRWQVHHAGADAAALPRSAGISAYWCHVIRTEGLVRGLWMPGLGSNLVASAIARGIGIGAYPLVRDTVTLISGTGEKHWLAMASAGMISGMVGYGIANPVYQMKTRLQSGAGEVTSSTGKLMTGSLRGQRPPFRNGLHGLVIIARTEGIVSGLFRGVSALVLRGAVMNMGVAFGYDGTKTLCKAHKLLDDGPRLHVVAALASGVAQTACLPADVLMTRYQSSLQMKGAAYTGLGDCAASIWRQEGLRAFSRGWLPLCARTTPLALLFFPLYEQMRRVVGLGFMD